MGKTLARATAVLGTALATWGATDTLAEPYRPTSPDTVLVRLPGLRDVRVAPASLPDPDPTPSEIVPDGIEARTAARKARELVSAARRLSDPRLLGQARVQLRPWWQDDQAPPDLILLRAEIRQGLHDFRSAQADVDLALRASPRHPGAWLLKAGLHQVRGEYDLARAACLGLTRFADELTAVTLAASLASLADPSEAPASRLASALRRHPAAELSVLAWAHTTLAEIQIRTGHAREAETSLRTALGLETAQPYALATLADLYLDTGRASEAIDLLKHASSDTLRLRLAEAHAAVSPDAPETVSLERQLAEIFALATRRGDELHLREHARFALRLAGQPETALHLARRNWDVQKEPADLLLLLEAATAAGDTALRRDVSAWAERHQPAVLRSSEPGRVTTAPAP